MRLLDLFSGEGGAGEGYRRAGFDVVGVDHRRLDGRYRPGRFVRADALGYLADHAGEYDAVHASPPCQLFTAFRAIGYPSELDDTDALFAWTKHRDLIAATRAALVATGLPYVIENVPNAPLVDPVILCGSMFGLAADCRDGLRRPLRRHRLFETNWPATAPPHPRHSTTDPSPVGVYGHGGGGKWRARAGYQAWTEEAAQALGIDWMTARGLSQAIPPAYTEHLGAQLFDLVAGPFAGAAGDLKAPALRRASHRRPPATERIMPQHDSGGVTLSDDSPA